MTIQDTLHPVFTETFPSTMDAGMLYVSIVYRTCGHLCCCGCGHEVITPLSPAQWSITYNGENVSLAPSVGNWSLPCQSHYWIRDGRVRWSRRYSTVEIDQNRARDRGLLDPGTTAPEPGQPSGLRRYLRLRRP
ncbi:DUF6527 family protein [Kitasatospora indigofera]|uniref:DUF6527 family protein n=1 Tax=Kitasatospora indigofera TaxID=67307 RepID=UPI00362ECF9C